MQSGGDVSQKGVHGDGSVSSLVAAAHELKAPLALIRQLALSLDTVDTATQARLADQIRLTAERSLRLTADITRSVRLDDALFTLAPINPLILCEEVARELQPLYRARGRRLVVRRRKQPLLMVANAELLRRIVTNFSDNALHYANDRGVVEIGATKIGAEKVRIEVRDYGPAVSLRDWRTLSDRLGAPHSLQARPDASGLGLMLAAEFARAMHGTLGVVRHRNGLSFYVEGHASHQLRLV